MLNDVKKTIEDNGLIETGDAVLVGLSGGPDSVALLHILAKLPKQMKLRIGAVYINHSIRPRAAKKEAEFCRAFCDTLDVGYHEETIDVPEKARKRKKGIEEVGRDVRYEAFDRLAAEHGYNKIAVGHHKDDRVETILFRIARGTGLAGLAGMPIKRGLIIRPLYDISKTEITAYLKKNKLACCVDRSNLESEYKRNLIRNELLPAMREGLNPQIDRALLNLSETASEEDRFIEDLVDGPYERTVRLSVGGKFELELTKFLSYHKIVRVRMLRRCLAEISSDGLAPDKATIERLTGFVSSGKKSCSLPGGIQAALVDRKLLLYRRQRRSFGVELPDKRWLRLEQLRLKFRWIRAEHDGHLIRERNLKVVVVDAAKLVLPLMVRSLFEGDRFQPLGMSGSKKVGDYLTDRKVDPVYRNEIPVVCDQRGIVWLVGYEIADRVKVGPATDEVIRIESSQRK